MSETGAKPRILFVDDEEEILLGLKANLRRKRRSWDLRFIVGAEAALHQVREWGPEVVVSDMRMPEMDGATLLARIREEHPSCIRIVLSGHADRDATVRALASAQRWIAKPCSRDELVAALDSALVASKLGREAAESLRVGGVSTLPSPPRLLERLRSVAADPGAGAADIEKVIESDPAMAAKLLQLSNSAFFCLPREIVEVREAIARLGTDLICSLLTSEAVFASADDRMLLGELDVEALRMHSVLVGRVSARIASECGGDSATALTAGLLHDCGILAASIHSAASRRKGRDVANPSEEIRATHAGLGAGLLGAWGLPLAIIEAAACHHDLTALGESPGLETSAVHFGNFLANEIEGRQEGRQNSATPSPDAVAALGGDSQLERWQGIAEEEFTLVAEENGR